MITLYKSVVLVFVSRLVHATGFHAEKGSHTFDIYLHRLHRGTIKNPIDTAIIVITEWQTGCVLQLPCDKYIGSEAFITAFSRFLLVLERL